MSNSTLLAEWGETIFSPTPFGLIIGILLVITVPIFLHNLLYKTPGRKTLPSILIIGPMDSGKTSLLTLLERGTPAQTHTSMLPITVECTLASASDKYRAVDDPLNTATKFLLTDTPGHGKLRHHALSKIPSPSLVGIIFLVDAAALSSGSDALRQTADYLHDILLLLQKRTESKAGKKVQSISVLVGANKIDLFTALPAKTVQNLLEKEVGKVRASRAKGLLEAGVDGGAEEECDDWLGEVGSTDFRFAQMEEFDVAVEVLGGNVAGEKPDIEKWKGWVSERI